MPIAATAVWEVRTTGDDLNGGAFNPSRTPAGTDYSQQDSPQVTIAASGITATVHSTTTQITLVGYTVLAADNGNHLRISGGTATAGVYEITAVDTVNNRYTLDRSAGTSTQTVQGRIGGCFASPQAAFAIAVGGTATNGNLIWCKTGTYDAFANGTVNTVGNRIASALAGLKFRGYAATRGDGGIVSFNAGAATMTVLSFTGQAMVIENIEVQGNGFATVLGINAAAAQLKVANLRAVNCRNTGILISGSGAEGFNLLADGCSGAGGSIAIQGVSRVTYAVVLNPVSGGGFVFNSTGGSTAEHCVVIAPSGAGAFGGFVVLNTPNVRIKNCSVMGRLATYSGFSIDVNSTGFFINCVAQGCTTGFNSLSRSLDLTSCAGFGNTTDVTGATFNNGFITLSATPFTDAAGNDLTLNNTAGGGALLRGTGYPATFPGLSPANSLDVGAYQRQQSSGSAQSAYGFIA